MQLTIEITLFISLYKVQWHLLLCKEQVEWSFCYRD